MAQVTYTVKKGDTLSKIAREHNTTVSAIAKLNPDIKDVNKIYIGQKIVISGTAATTTSNPTSLAVVTHFGLLANSDREVYAAWSWDKHDTTEHYEYIWYYSWGAGVAVESKGTTDQRYCSFTAPAHATHVSFIVKPIAKTKKDSKGNEVALWNASGYSTKKTYWFSENPPKTPPDPNVVISEDCKLTATLDNLQDLNAESIEFHVYQDNGHLVASDTVKIVTFHAAFTCSVEPGHEYKVQCRSWRGDLHSDWSGYSGNQNTAPASPSGITVCRATSSTSVHLEWGAVSNATEYDILYSTDRAYLESSNQTSSASSETNSYDLGGLESGKEYFFKVRASNDKGKSPWTSIVSVIIGKKPEPPTTWSSTSTAIAGEDLILYWVHNSADGSKWKDAVIELLIDDGEPTVVTITNDVFGNDEEQDKTGEYQFDTSSYVEGTKLLWRVRTCGITEEYSDWSMQREVNIYGRPTLAMNVTDTAGTLLESLTQFPFKINCHAGPSTQTAIGYHLSIIANSSYETVDNIGNRKIVSANSAVYSRYFDVTGDLDITLSANDLDLENNVTYTVNCIVTMDSGLNAESKWNFTVAWEELIYEPNAEISIDESVYSAQIRPYCRDVDDNLIEGVTLSVYRREINGKFTEIGSGIANNAYTYVVDPHPALDYARYRIVAIAEATGSVSYCDLAGVPVDMPAIVIQWDEQWRDFDYTIESEYLEPPTFVGSMLRLPYNVDVSNKYKMDVALVNYIGREHPVSYYGTQLGETATWKAEIPAYDKATLYGLRRLAAWTGDAYVREPSGSGYWAHVNVSFDQTHCKVTIPITIEVTRVEGGV